MTSHENTSNESLMELKIDIDQHINELRLFRMVGHWLIGYHIATLLLPMVVWHFT